MKLSLSILLLTVAPAFAGTVVVEWRGTNALGDRITLVQSTHSAWSHWDGFLARGTNRMSLGQVTYDPKRKRILCLKEQRKGPPWTLVIKIDAETERTKLLRVGDATKAITLYRHE